MSGNSKMTDLLIPFASEETALRAARLIAKRCNIRGIALCDGRPLHRDKLAKPIDLRDTEAQEGGNEQG